MASYRSLSAMAMATLFLALFTVSSASNMSIIAYDGSHSDESSWRTDEEVMTMYEAWLAEHGKVYNALGEKDGRFQIFKDNLRYIDAHNSQDRTYKLGLNRFADLTNEEYRSKYLGTKKLGSKKRLSDRYAPKDSDNLPDSVDWREKGAVTDIKDQGSCGEFLY